MPSFASQEYWENRFTKDSTPFDWLIPANSLRKVIKDCTDETKLPRANILNIGCGTADSQILRQLVNDPQQVHNVDYSQSAVDSAAAREKAQSNDETLTGKHDSIQGTVPERQQLMRWSCLDLLSLHSTLALLEGQAGDGDLYDLVVDKSTSDSIACGADVSINLPYLLSINGWTRGILQSGIVQTAEVHPLHLLAVHLAAVTKPRTGKWIVISYSEDRFPFVPPYPRSVSHGLLEESVVRAGFTHPSQLWTLEVKESVKGRTEDDETLAERKKRLSTGVVHRPETPHWLYVLRRTDALVTD